MEVSCYDQQLLDLVFNDLEHLLAQERPTPPCLNAMCVGCGGSTFCYSTSGSSYPGAMVCDDCGIVQPGCVIYEQMFGKDLPRRSSNYKRIHHWHERISQLLLMESEVPQDKMLRIAAKLCDGSYSVVNKDTVRAVLRSLGMQLYIEKWLQIIFRITKIAPPIPGNILVSKLDSMFQDLQHPFDCYRTEKRKNFLNYNYVFCRLFQRMGCTQFCMFFPLIKSKQKLRQLDDMWRNMAKCLDWEVTPLVAVAPFAVRLEQPALLLQRLASEYVPTIPAEIQTTLPRTVFRTLDRRAVDRLTSKLEQRRSTPPESLPQTPLAEKKHRRSGVARRPRLLNRRQRQVRHG